MPGRIVPRQAAALTAAIPGSSCCSGHPTRQQKRLLKTTTSTTGPKAVARQRLKVSASAAAAAAATMGAASAAGRQAAAANRDKRQARHMAARGLSGEDGNEEVEDLDEKASPPPRITRRSSPRVFQVALDSRGRHAATPKMLTSKAATAVARKSGDLKRIRDPGLRAMALVNSPMIDSRRQQRKSAMLTSPTPACLQEPPQQRQTEPAVSPEDATIAACLKAEAMSLSSEDSAAFLTERDRVTRAYRMLLHQQWEHFRQLIGDWREVLNTEAATIPEAGQGLIRAAVGMAELLTAKKFRFFESMVDACGRSSGGNSSSAADPTAEPPTLPDDLHGYWALVEREIADVGAKFARVEAERRDGWPLKEAARMSAAKPGAKRGRGAAGKMKAAPAVAPAPPAKSKFAEFRKKFLPSGSRTAGSSGAGGVGPFSSPMVTFATLSSSSAASRRGTKTPKAGAAKTPTKTTRTPSTAKASGGSTKTPKTKTPRTKSSEETAVTPNLRRALASIRVSEAESDATTVSRPALKKSVSFTAKDDKASDPEEPDASGRRVQPLRGHRRVQTPYRQQRHAGADVGVANLPAPPPVMEALENSAEDD